MASGQYSNNIGITFPLVAISIDSGNTWTYPSYVYQDLNAKIDPNLAIASFVRGAASGGELKLQFKNKQFGLENIVQMEFKKYYDQPIQTLRL